MDEVPFKTVYLHGLVRDKQGRKMSKSLDNGIDPLDMIEKFGTDSVRLSLVLGSSPGNDTRLYEEKIAGYRNFVNKIWNGARFALMTLDADDFNAKIDPKTLSRADKWILHRLNEVIKQADKALLKYRLSEAGTLIYDFFWSEFCDWYLEISKVQPNRPVLAHVLKTQLKLLHPFTPYITEALWEKMNQKSQLITSAWPTPEPKHNFPAAKREMGTVIDVVTAIRQMRAESKVEPAQKIEARLYGHTLTAALKENIDVIKSLARLSECHLAKEGVKPENSLGQFVGPIELYLPMEGLINPEKERTRLQKEITNLEGYLKGLNGKLSNKGYLKGAPATVVEADKKRATETEEKLSKLKEQVKSLK
jgi:valyl-tRNA synthetase